MWITRVVSALLLSVIAAAPPSISGVVAAPLAQACEFQLGFKALHDLIPDIVGDCVSDETHNPDNGDALQQTSGGLLVWRKADNWTAFTNGATTWINGPCGLQSRPNDERFPWEQGGGCGDAQANTSDAVLLAAGDIADCDLPGAEQTAAVVDGQAGTVAALGDEAYEDGSAAQFARCYDPTWGRFKDRTRPTPGNHEYHQPGAAPYFAYFGAAAGEPGKGWYSYDLGAWHIVVLNSNCDDLGPGACHADSEQGRWLQADLAAHPARCTLAYWHHPRFSSGPHGNDSDMRHFWEMLYAAGADVVLNGHDHQYERFAPQDPQGHPDPARGIREFVVGTGGAERYPFSVPQANSEVRNGFSFGVLKLTLHPGGYDWQFLPAAGLPFTDSGSGACVS